MQGLGGEKSTKFVGRRFGKTRPKSSWGRWAGKTQLKAIKIAPRLGEANPSTNTAHERRAWQHTENPRRILIILLIRYLEQKVMQNCVNDQLNVCKIYKEQVSLWHWHFFLNLRTNPVSLSRIPVRWLKFVPSCSLVSTWWAVCKDWITFPLLRKLMIRPFWSNLRRPFGSRS